MNLRCVDKWGSGESYIRPRIAYVRCLSCNARGPIVGKLRYDIRNERPSICALQSLHDEAIRRWNAATGEDLQPDDSLLPLFKEHNQ